MPNHLNLQIVTQMNSSVLDDFQQVANTHAHVRDAVIAYVTDLDITTTHSIKLQASILAQLTEATNQLTRNALVRLYTFK